MWPSSFCIKNRISIVLVIYTLLSDYTESTYFEMLPTRSADMGESYVRWKQHMDRWEQEYIGDWEAAMSRWGAYQTYRDRDANRQFLWGDQRINDGDQCSGGKKEETTP